MSESAGRDRLLAIYLNDHLAGSILGVELCRRVLSSNREDPELGEPLARLCAEIEADRQTLVEVTERLGVRRDPLKPLLARVAERLGRLKPNGRLRGYSPLSRLLELEALAIAVEGKHRLWTALDDSLGDSLTGLDFRALAERAEQQRRRVAELHLTAAGRAIEPASR
jgi:hypothetical protein